ncbi:hypothetical protein H0H81_009502 [Sphagnurus paluster]|uniref:Uncharacterized protein n=1 Tax=Sphagnurus paluster TaxID=117069 RepID=A0A9P7KML8_9AGAR|nr:hypothetical protein H0H81_009502 [Sphagnurus paluster]
MGALWTLQSSQPGLSFYSALPVAYGTSYYTLSLGLNIILTILITIRLLIHRRNILATLPEEHAKDYVSLMTIIIESAALYSVFAFLFLITYAVDHPINQIFLGVASFAQVGALFSLPKTFFAHAPQGRAWGKDTLATHLSTLNFDKGHPTGGTSHVSEIETVYQGKSISERGDTSADTDAGAREGLPWVK